MNISKLLFCLISFCIFCFSKVAGQHSDKFLNYRNLYEYGTDNMEYVKNAGFRALKKGDYYRASEYGKELYNLSKFAKDKDYQLSAHICLGQSYVMLRNRDSAFYHLSMAKEIAQKEKNHKSLGSIYNGLGLYASNIETDFHRSLAFFFEALENAQISENEELQSIILANISGIYYLKNDTAGLKYSLSCYEIGHKNRNPHIIFMGATNSAYLFYLKGDYDKALNFIKEAEFVNEKNQFRDKSNIYSIYGLILLKTNNREEALKLFNKSIEVNDSKIFLSSLMNTYRGYGLYYMEEGDWNNAIKNFKKGLNISYEMNHAIYRCDLIDLLSKAYENSQTYDMALYYRKLFESQSDSLVRRENERLINDMHIKYETRLKESELKNMHISLSKKEQKMRFLIIIIITLLILSSVIYLMYRHKNKLYFAIVKQRKNAMKQEDYLRETIKSLQKGIINETAVPEKYNTSLSTEKSIMLFRQLEGMMREEKPFMNADLTRESMAESLNTNRTYLSQIINEQTNLSFNQYVNNYRIEEAIRILSDNNNDMPLKAVCSHIGFRSMTTFYNLFQNTVSMTPAQYRAKSLQMKSKENQ